MKPEKKRIVFRCACVNLKKLRKKRRNMVIQKLLKKLIKKGVPLTKIAYEVGVSIRTIERWANGTIIKNSPGVEIILRVMLERK